MRLIDALNLAKLKFGYQNIPDPRNIVWTNEFKAEKKRIKGKTAKEMAILKRDPPSETK